MCFRKRNKKRKVALFFGSFNPIHYGHLAILEYLVNRSEADEVRIVVSPESPFKEGNMVTAKERLVNAGTAIEASGLNVIVSDVEYHLEPPLYTINTLHYLDSVEPDCEHILVMGGDNIASLERWKCGSEIMRDYRIWVYPRTGTDAHAVANDLKSRYKVKGITIFDDAEIHDISSTMLRGDAPNPAAPTATP